MVLKHKFIKDEQLGAHTWLRRISRETETLMISEGQRYFITKDVIDTDKYEYLNFRCKKYRKQPDGTLTKVGYIKKYRDKHNKLTLINDIESLKCKCSFNELFNTDIRDIQSFDGYPNERHFPNPLETLTKFESWRKWRIFKSTTVFFKLKKHIKLLNAKDEEWQEIGCLFSKELIAYLEEIFKVPVYFLPFKGKVDESYAPFSKLTESLTYFQITHFGDDKKIITSKENRSNNTIAFWYFDDRLIIQDESGKDTW